MEKSNNLIYLFYGILGGLLFIIIHHYSLKKDSKLCALIAAIPILGLFGLISTHINNSNTKNYIVNLIIFFFIYIFLFMCIYILFSYTNNIIISIIISTIIWLIIVCSYLNMKLYLY